MKLLLHIGTEKTGTTLLQDWLYANQQALSVQGVLLSDQLGKTNNRKLVSYFQHHLDDFMRQENVSSLDDKSAYFAGFEARFVEEIQNGAKNHHTMVITSEHFHSRLCGLGEIRKLAEFLKAQFSEIKVLCYFREQSQMRESLYSTGLKVGTSQPPEEFQADANEDTYYYNFYRIATQWSEAFGRENTDFRIYDRTCFYAKDIRKDFLTALFAPVDMRQLSFETTSSNESLSLLEGRMFRVINQNIPYWAPEGGINPVNGFFKGLVARCSRLKIGRIQDRRKSVFAEQFRDSNRMFFNSFFGGENAFRSSADEGIKEDSLALPLQEVAKILEEVVDVFSRCLPEKGLLDQDANVLRDVALKYETGKPLTRAEALALMKLAHRARPQGALIQKKIRDWSAPG